MPVPKVDERVAGNDPHGGLYHVPRLGTTPNAERLRQVFHYLRRLHLFAGTFIAERPSTDPSKRASGIRLRLACATARRAWWPG
jgi:hypothetical protein